MVTYTKARHKKVTNQTRKRTNKVGKNLRIWKTVRKGGVRSSREQGEETTSISKERAAEAGAEVKLIIQIGKRDTITFGWQLRKSAESGPHNEAPATEPFWKWGNMADGNKSRMGPSRWSHKLDVALDIELTFPSFASMRFCFGVGVPPWTFFKRKMNAST